MAERFHASPKVRMPVKFACRTEARVKSEEPGRIVLIDENVMIANALRVYLEKSIPHRVEILRSIDEMDDSRYELIFLNLSYHQNYEGILRTIKKIETHDFGKAIVFSDICLYKCYPIGIDNRVDILCRRGLWNFVSSSSEIRPDDPLCTEECEVSKLHEENGDDELRERLQALSIREKEVLRMIGRGLSSKEIADTLHVSRRTIDFHRANILRKMNLVGLSQMICLALYYLTNIIE